MTEADAISASSKPATLTSLTADLRALGVDDGAVVIAHVSLSRLGWVVGADAEAIVADHSLSPGLGQTSPLGRLYARDAHVLLLGVDHANNTSLHLAEHRAQWPSKTMRAEGAAVFVDGVRRWISYEDLDLDESDFASIGEAFAATGRERRGPVGAGIGRKLGQPLAGASRDRLVSHDGRDLDERHVGHATVVVSRGMGR